MSNFNKIYNNIINNLDRTISEDFNTIEPIILGEFDITNYFNTNIIQFNQDDIINESKLYENIDFGDNLIYRLINSTFGELFTYDIILPLLNKNWIFYNQYKNSIIAKSIPFYIFNFDFNTGNCAFDVVKFLNFKGVYKLGKDKIINEFKQYIHCDGFTKDYTNCCILQCDSNKLTKKLINHELNHYFQIILNINLNINGKDLTDLKSDTLNLSNNDIKYLFNEHEFYTHLYIDVISDLTKFYYKCYTNISKSIFIEKLILAIKTYNEYFLKSNIAKQFIANINSKDISTLLFLAGSYIFNINWEIVEKTLKEKFKE